MAANPRCTVTCEMSVWAVPTASVSSWMSLVGASRLEQSGRSESLQCNQAQSSMTYRPPGRSNGNSVSKLAFVAPYRCDASSTTRSKPAGELGLDDPAQQRRVRLIGCPIRPEAVLQPIVGDERP